MAGQNMYQRHTLTLNGGTYYLDTSVPLNTQQTEPFTKKPGAARDVNVFEGGQTYYVFFLYTKPSTNQTYQIYVGDGFQRSTVKPVRGNLKIAPIKFSAGPIRLVADRGRGQGQGAHGDGRLFRLQGTLGAGGAQPREQR